jgi:hypothetical protein
MADLIARQKAAAAQLAKAELIRAQEENDLRGFEESSQTPIRPTQVISFFQGIRIGAALSLPPVLSIPLFIAGHKYLDEVAIAGGKERVADATTAVLEAQRQVALTFNPRFDPESGTLTEVESGDSQQTTKVANDVQGKPGSDDSGIVVVTPPMGLRDP